MVLSCKWPWLQVFRQQAESAKVAQQQRRHAAKVKAKEGVITQQLQTEEQAHQRAVAARKVHSLLCTLCINSGPGGYRHGGMLNTVAYICINTMSVAKTCLQILTSAKSILNLRGPKMMGFAEVTPFLHLPEH